ncbi:tRNA pseudouridine(38-40) synthase TruA [Chloroflexota bacterium]
MVTTAVSPEIKHTVNPATTTRIVLIVEYDGTRYHGFQLQAKQTTVQSELEKALQELTGEKIRVVTASRTDAGVHAKGQVVSFMTASSHSPETFVKGLNYYLPEDIAVKDAHRVKDAFNVRRQAVSREYNYYILNSQTRSPLRERFYYLVPGHLDIEAMNQASRALIGQHDFISFVNNKEVAAKSTVRRVYRAEINKEGDIAVFNIVANAFLMHQVRNTVGALIRVGRGRMSPEQFWSIMEVEKAGLAWPMAPARGLCLMQVNYAKPFEDEIC